jgi:hypothetical protein
MSKFELSTPMGNEKLALSRTGNNLYVGGSNGLHVYNRTKGNQDYYCSKADETRAR